MYNVTYKPYYYLLYKVSHSKSNFMSAKIKNGATLTFTRREKHFPFYVKIDFKRITFLILLSFLRILYLD